MVCRFKLLLFLLGSLQVEFVLSRNLLMSFNLFHESDSLGGKRLCFDAELNVVFDFHVQFGFVDPLVDFS